MKFFKKIIIIIIFSSFPLFSIYIYYKYENNKKFFLGEITSLEKRIIEKEKKNVKLQWEITEKLITKDRILKKILYNNFFKKAETHNINILNSKYVIDKYKLIFVPRSVESGNQVFNQKNTGYIDIYKENYFYINGDGSLISFEIKDKILRSKYLETNLLKIIKDSNFYSLSTVGIKDMRIFDDRIYVSYLKNYPSKVEDNDCYNLAVLESDKLSEINFLKNDKKEINFNNFFEFDYRCTSVIANNTNQNGGRLEKINNYFYITVGDFRIPGISQDLSNNNNFGKIIKFKKNLKNQFKIISMGHRNPQGLFYDKDKKYLISSEHGPKGGDEINLIDTSLKNQIQNFGWDISSYGDHYSGEKNLPKLKKSHSNFGFIEPLKYFVPSIAIQDINKIKIKDSDLYVVSSLGSKAEEGDLSLHFFDIIDNKYIENDIVNIKQRIRDLAYDKNKNKLLLVLENPTTIASINLK